MTRLLPAAIERAIASLEALAGCRIQGVPAYDETRRWALPIEIEIESPGRFVGTRTDWYVVIDDAYPFGELGVYPAVVGGITATFQHQERNSPAIPGDAWRRGKLCLETRFRRGFPEPEVRDPVGDEQRLRWYVERAQQWIIAAAADQLVGPGDPFELPARAPTFDKPEMLRVVHDESTGDCSRWLKYLGKWGAVELAALSSLPTALCAAEFFDSRRQVVRSWVGRSPRPLKEATEAWWWLWPQPAVVAPWHSPGTWGELRRAGKAANVDVDRVLRHLSQRMRASERPLVLLLGYPIPRNIGGQPVEVYWSALLLPQLPPPGSVPSGFRPNAAGWWHRDRHGKLRDSKPLHWMATENWQRERLVARGSVSSSLSAARIAIVGLGALGSKLAEHLVRAGSTRLTLIDGQILSAGNVCRHTATLRDVSRAKVEAVKARLEQISPSVEVEAVDIAIDGAGDFVREAFEDFEVIVDCTASDSFVNALASAWWTKPKAFASYSIGSRARRLYGFGIVGHAFPVDDFKAALAPWTEDRDELVELREGPGCWSPLFAARDDEVALAAAVCVRELQSLLLKQFREPRSRVFEVREEDGDFMGLVVLPTRPVVART